MKNSTPLADQQACLIELFSNDGTPTDFGCDEADIEAMLKESKSIADLPTCVVSHWIIWDFAACPETENPAFFVVKANRIIDDELQRFPPGRGVRTSPVKQVYKNCIFLTKNTAYILVGNGNRKRMTESDALRFSK